ncbi:MAG: hypothetical protein HYS80_00105 [Candidatus Aenigmarchaeota archaeon]|nr:hypothetical protein [Candidatus Aenigmarchaeota archaeon]
MRSKHGFKFISKIPSDNLPILHESWQEYADKVDPNENDRAKNITYDLPQIGKVTVSHTTGTITIDTNKSQKELLKTIRKYVGGRQYESFESNLVCKEAGAHFRKFHGTVGYILNVKQPGKIPIFLSARGCNSYADIHIKIPWKMADIEDFSKKDYTPTSTPIRKYTLDTDILDLVKKRDVVRTKDCSAVNLSESAFYRRLEKLRIQGKLTRTNRYPALYMSNPLILQKAKQDLYS